MLNNFFKFFTVVLLLVTFAFSSNAFAQLVGGTTYPINGTEAPPASFGSITTAASYLATNGVTGTGQVILELNTGYAGEPGPVTIGAITGTSATLGVTFRPALGYIASTSIVGAASPNQHAIKLTGNYVTLDGRAGGVGSSRDWTISCTGTNGQMAVRLDNTTNSMTGIVVRNLIMEGAATNTTGGIFQITGSTTNTISNITIEQNLLQSGATLRGYGMTLAVASNVGNTGIIVRNNIIRQFYARGINLTGGFPGIEIYGNEIYHSAAVTQPSTTEFAGFYFSTTASTGAKIYNNYIHDIQLTNGTTGAYGMYFFNGNTSGAPIEIFNNRIQIGNGITATTIPIYGIRDNAVAGSLFNIYFNTILVDGIASAGTSNSAAFRKEVSNFINLRNNVFYNARSNSGGTGVHWGISVNNTTFVAINNNDYFADGTGGVLGTTTGLAAGNQLTLANWKAAVTADLSSVSQNPNFVAGLKINTGIATQLESGGTPIVSVTTDFEGDSRNATTPDIGADEFAGIGLDLAAPVISYTALGPTTSTSARTLIVNVTDAGSGVPTTSTGWPNLYWRINAGAWTAATPIGVAGSDYTYSFGAGVIVGDVVSYYVVAQDLAGTPNVGAFPSAGAGGFTTNPPAASTPPTTPSSYLIVGAPLAGTYTVGLNLFNSLTGRNITFEKSVTKVMREVIVPDNSTEKTKDNSYSDALSLAGQTKLVEVEEVSWIPMENGAIYKGDLFIKKSENPQANFGDGIDGIYATITAAVADLNLRGVSAPTTFSLVDATYYTETFPIVIDVTSVNVPTATNTVTFKPALGVSPIIAGNATSLFKLFGADYITFDGSNTVGGTTRDMTIMDSTQVLSGVIWIGSKSASDGASFNTVKNCNIKGFSGSTTTAGVIMGSGTTLGSAAEAPNNNNTITNNNITAVQNAVYHSGFATTQDQNIIITNNLFGSTVVAEKLGFRGAIFINAGNFTATGNTINGVVTSSTSTAHGIQLSSVINGGTIAGNKISDIKNTNSGGYSAIGITLGSSSTAANVLVANNFVWDVTGYGWTSLTTDMGNAMNIVSGGGYNIYHNTLALTTDQTLTTSVTGVLMIGSTVAVGSLDIRDNIIASFQTVGANRYALLSNAANTVFSSINYNDYYTLGANLGYLGSNRLNLDSLRISTGQDVNSISGDPGFVSATDLHIETTNNMVSNNGTPIAAVTTDIDGGARSLTTPDMGADEYIYAPPSVIDPTAVTATAISQTQIDVAFTRNANLNNVLIVWNATGTFTAPVGAPPAVGQPFAGGTVMYYGPTSPAAHTGLTASTLYYYKAFSYNGSLYSPGIDVSATTFAAPITSFPYTQDFTGTFPPTGFSNYGTKTWTQTLTGGVGGSAAARVSYTPAGTANLQMPNVVLPATPSYRVKFWWKDNDIAARPGDGPEIAGYDTTYFEVSTDGGTSWTVLSFLAASSSQSAYVESINDLSPYAGQTISLRWRDVSDGSFSAYGTGLDDITVEQTPSVLDPTAFTATTINSSQINLTFTPDPATHNVLIVWNSTGTFTVPSGTPPAVGQPFAGGTVLSYGTTSPVSHTGLTFATTYYYKAFSYDGATYSTPGATANAITNVVNPTAVTANPISGTQINLGWTKNANNDNVMVVTNSVNTFGVPVNGTAYAVNDPVTGGGTVVYNGSAANFNHTSLTAGTTYYYKLFSAEAVTNNYSSGVTANATTPFALPYFQNFNAATTIPAGWSTTFSVSATHGASGTNGLYRNLYSSVTTASARTPFVGLAAANTTLEFDYRIVDFTGYPATGTVYAAGNYIQVQVSTDNTTWNTVYTIDNTTHVTSNAFANKQLSLSAYSGSYVYVRFNCQWASGDYYIDFDNVYVGPPSVANPGTFTASTFSTTQIDLAFTTNPSTNNVVIVWNNTGTFTVPSGTPPAVGQPFAGGTLLSNGIVSPVNHTGLTPSTAYYYKAFSYNGTDYSTGLDANASTACGVASLPFNESFDGTLFPPTCWTRINAGTGNNWSRSTAAPYSGAGNMRYSYSSTSAANSWMITPEFTLTSGKKYYVSFYQNTSGSYPEKLKVTVGSAPDVVSQTTVLWDNAGGTSLINATYELRIAEFVAPTTGSYYFGFNCYSDADQWYLDVDDISIIEQPTVDLAFTQFSQTSGLPVPKAGQNFSDYNVTMNKQTLIDGKKQTIELTNQSNAVSSSNVNNTVIVPENGLLNLDALGNIGVSAQISNLGVNAASYNLNWNVDGISQSPYAGPTVNSGSNHVADLTFVSTNRGTFITSGAITVAGDEIASNNANQFRMRVYPDVFTRTIYDRGDNLVDTYIGWGTTATTPFKAGVRFTAASEIKLAGVDFIYRTEDLVPGEITVQVRAAGTTTTAPGAVLYTAVYNSAAYFSSTGDYIHLPFGNDAPIIASGSDYWITVKVPLGVDYPGAAQTGAGITLGRSFYESNTDTTLWNALILTPDEFAWMMRSVQVAPGPATFAFSKSVNNGWNMVSTPGNHPVDQNVTTWWSGKDPAAGVFRFSGGYLPVTTTIPGQGYWMKHAGAFTYNYTGIQVVANTPIAGVTGWNLIGGFELTVLTSGITTTPAGLQTGSVFQYGTGYTVATNLVPGNGYWIKLTGAGSINVPTSLAKGLAKTEVNTSDWGKIIITDALGKSYTLYTVKGEVNLNDYELPPAPPEGMFDVRFGSGRYAEELSAVNQTIELNSLEYPVRVRVENADIRLQDGTGNGLNERLRSGEEVTISNSAINKLMVSGDVIPATYSLDQNYPNPFNPSTKIEFSIPEDVNNVTLTIYNALGQRVAELVNSKMEAGKYSYVWNASDVATGLYIYELRTDKFVSVKKMMLLK